MLRRSALLPALLLTGLLGSAAAADELQKLRQKLARERDPAARAKITVKIGEELLEQVSEQYEQNAYSEADRLLGDYLAAVRTAHQDLQQSGRDARRKPKGFKHLEIHLRKSRRKLEDMARGLPFDKRAPVETAMTEVEGMRTELLQALMKADRKPKSDTKGNEPQP